MLCYRPPGGASVYVCDAEQCKTPRVATVGTFSHFIFSSMRSIENNGTLFVFRRRDHGKVAGASLGFTPLDLTERGITHLASVPNFNIFVKLRTKNKPNVIFVVARLKPGSRCSQGVWM